MRDSQRPALHDDPSGDPSERPSEGPSDVRPEDRPEGRSDAPGDVPPAGPRTPSRRALLGAGAAVAGSGLLAACGTSDTGSGPDVKAGLYGSHPSRRPHESPGPRTSHGSHGSHGAAGSPAPHGTHRDHDGHGSHDSHGRHGSHGGGGSEGRPPRGYVAPDGPEVAECERKRKRGSGPVRHFTLTAAPTRLELGGGRTVRTWAYGDELPGKEIRVTAGERIALTLHNHLPQSTTVHWHGLHVRNDMDGVPDLTQRAVRPGGSFDYRFTVTDPGTHWLHPHVGVQLDRGLYAPLIVEDPREPLSYDREWVVLIDDWLDGIDGHTPDALLAGFLKRAGRHGGGMGHMGGMGMNMDMGDDGKGGGGTATRHGHGHDEHDGHGGHGHRHGHGKGDHGHGHGSPRRPFGRRRLWGNPGSVDHPLHLINGRTAGHPHTFRARPGDRIRIRIINAGGDTSYRVALGGHRMTVTHTDGYPVRHAKTDTLLLGVGERYDVLVTAKDGAFPLTALAEGKRNRSALAVLRTASGAAPGPSDRPGELRGKLMTADRLKAAESVLLSARRPDRVIDMTLTGNMARYNWAINGRPYSPYQRYPVRSGERVRIVFRNHTRMWHPMHLHGHTFALPHGGPRKDTTIVLPGRQHAVDFDADNPGLWMVHCHNIYHSESGMMTILGYRS
ncbi:multicopper oxidase domain-containing protein [Streptomyces bugieae]|uniref:Multicopper oxidase domain-containing protein n=1 Tax=Streptomyces bugieae TaxID=3098223 RepID=A0ABU7P392_9ACTN|nr:multicopper oxidase domain-containing protein [Streptomyces sp. DSM 41528]